MWPFRHVSQASPVHPGAHTHVADLLVGVQTPLEVHGGEQLPDRQRKHMHFVPSMNAPMFFAASPNTDRSGIGPQTDCPGERRVYHPSGTYALPHSLDTEPRYDGLEKSTGTGGAPTVVLHDVREID